MSDSHDQSYYEIALTNRQVMSIFVVLLVCVLVSFLGGVWLGRDADATVEMASTQAIVAGVAEDTPLEPLDFFRREDSTQRAPAGEGEEVAEASVATPARPREAGGRRAESAPSSANSPAKAATQASSEAAAKPGTAEKAAVPRAASKAQDELQAGPVERDRSPEPKARGAERKRGPVIETGAPDRVPSSVVIQVFSSNEEAQALRVADQLRKSGYPAILSPVEVAGRTLHRVRIGPYSDSDEAQVVAESVRRAFKFDTWITH